MEHVLFWLWSESLCAALQHCFGCWVWTLGLRKIPFLSRLCVCMLDQTKHERVLCGGALWRQCPGSLFPRWLCVLRILSNTVHM